MMKGKQHISDESIPEGLEFRQEYLDAALGAYRRTKRVLLWKKIGVACIVAGLLIRLGLTGFELMQPKELTSESNVPQTVGHSTQIPEKKIENTDNTSQTIDLEKSEAVLNEQRPSPAVESSKATQDRSSKATGMGGSMSSGVELPGQLSHHETNVISTRSNNSPETSNNTASLLFTEAADSDANNSQQTEEASQPNQHIGRSAVPDGLIAIASKSLPIERGLIPTHTQLPVVHRPWSLFASVGVKLWADYGFNARPMKPDALVGLGVNYAMNPKFSANLQARFLTISGVANPYTVVQRTYGTGFNETTYRYYTDRLLESGVALQMNYHLSEKHSLGLGWATNYLLTSDNHIETGTAASFENPTSSSTKSKGYTQGFNSLQHGVIFSYEYALGKSKSFGAQYQWGLTDVTKNKYFGEVNDRNSMLSLYFRIKLMP